MTSSWTVCGVPAALAPLSAAESLMRLALLMAAVCDTKRTAVLPPDHRPDHGWRVSQGGTRGRLLVCWIGKVMGSVTGVGNMCLC